MAACRMTFSAGSAIVAREDWHGYLHSATPALVVVDESNAIVEWTPAGTRAVCASSRQFPGREHLPRNERKLITLETSCWHYASIVSETAGLNFVDTRHWSRIALGWSASGEFLGWYVNFQFPMSRTRLGYDSMDLVLDIVVEPDGAAWRWKDESDFEAAIERQILGAELRGPVLDEADRVLGLLHRREGPFDPDWSTWRPPPNWRVPELPADFAEGLQAPEGSGRPESVAWATGSASATVPDGLAADRAGPSDDRDAGR